MIRFDDNDLSGLGSYLSEFTTAGAMPTSLSGYGTGQRAHNLELGALGAAAPATVDASMVGPKPSASTLNKGTARYLQLVGVLIKDLQSDLNALQAKAGSSGKIDTATKNAWALYTKVFSEPNTEFIPASGGIDSAHWVWVNQPARDKMHAFAIKAVRPGASPAPKPTQSKTPTKAAAATPKPAAAKAASTKPASAKTSPVTPAPTPAVSKGSMVATTADVQSLLKRIGWTDAALKSTFGAKPGALDDGLYGSTTQKAWAQSANKRKLNASIKEASGGKQVTVVTATYLALKNLADAAVPPQPGSLPAQPVGGSILSLGPTAITQVTADQLGTVLGRISGAKADAKTDLKALYEQVATNFLSVDPRIEQDPKGAIFVMKDAWSAFMKKYDELAPAPPTPAPGPQKSELDQAVAVIVKNSTSSVPVNTVRTAFNAAIQQGLLKHDLFKAGVWEQSLSPFVLDYIGVQAEPARSQWAAALVKGQLVSKDGKTLKLPQKQADSFKSVAAKYKASETAAVESFKGYTKVSPADIIARVNALHVSTVQFNKNGDAKELADAIQTFLENTKTPVPSGDIVKTSSDKKTVYVKDTVIATLSKAVKAADARAAATKKSRDALVANAVKEASATVKIADLQQALMDTVLSKSAGANAKLYGAVKLTNAFDAATRAAYTELARTLTIGPAIQAYQKLLQSQLGPDFKAALVTEIQNQVWGDFLKKTVAKDSLKVLPALAAKIADGAKAYKANTKADKIAADTASAQTKVLNDAIKKSTSIVSILDLQQALLQMMSEKMIDNVPGLKLTATASGVSPALLEVSSYIFPEGYTLPETMWAKYLSEVGITVVSASTVQKGWNSKTNYIALPASLADVISKKSSAYMLKNGVSKLGDKLAPIPLNNQALQVRFGTPSVITVQKPAAQTNVSFTDQEAAAPLPAPVNNTTAGGTSAGGAGGSASVTGPIINVNIQQPQPSAATANSSALAPYPVSAPQPVYDSSALLPPAPMPDTSSAATDSGATTGPVPTPPPAPVEAGMGGGLLWWILGGLVGGTYLVTHKDDKNKSAANKNQNRTGAKPVVGRKSKYSTRRRAS